MDLPVLFSIAASLGLLLPRATTGTTMDATAAACVLAVALLRGAWLTR